MVVSRDSRLWHDRRNWNPPRTLLQSCQEVLQSGTAHVKPQRIALNVFSTPSSLVRLLQVADVVTSCTVACVGGENRFAPPIFAVLRPMFRSLRGRVGGVGLKIHPDLKYLNLYHWLLGDTLFLKDGFGEPLPNPHHWYASDPMVPRNG
jgi:hypothetical protein